MRPVAYTITPFVTARCLEQIRVDVCYHNLPVVIVGTGSGLSYASLGATHHSCEDIAWLRSLPRMTVIAPGDPIEVRLALRAALNHDGPVYMRIGKKGEPDVHLTPPDFALGRGIEVRGGEDVALVSTGTLLPTSVAAASLLAQRGVDAAVVSMHTVKPLDEILLRRLVDTVPTIVTIEEHSRIGGLGSAVAEWLVDQPRCSTRLIRVGTPDDFFHEAGSQGYARERWGLTPVAIADRLAPAAPPLPPVGP